MATVPNTRPRVLQNLDWENLPQGLQQQLTNSAHIDPSLTDADVNNIILQDPTERLMWQSSPGGYNAGQMAAVYNARGATLKPSLAGLRRAALPSQDQD